MTRCAITPSDLGAPAAGVAIGPTVADCVERFTAPAQHPVNVANRERSMRAVDLALHFATQNVRLEIERPRALVVEGETCWYDTRPSCEGYHPDIEKAVQYIDLREPDALPWRFIRHPEQPHLVRFEAKP